MWACVFVHVCESWCKRNAVIIWPIHIFQSVTENRSKYTIFQVACCVLLTTAVLSHYQGKTLHLYAFQCSGESYIFVYQFLKKKSRKTAFCRLTIKKNKQKKKKKKHTHKKKKQQQQQQNSQGPVVQSIVSLTSSLRIISLTVLANSIYSILIYFAEKMWVAFATHIFSAKNFSIFAYHSM